jgi:hypothetical protein
MEQNPTYDSVASPGPEEPGVEPGRIGDLPHEPSARTAGRHGHAAGLRLGPDAIPEQAHYHTTERESGYGGTGDQPRVSSDHRPGT